MAKDHLSNEKFLSELTSLLQRTQSKDHASVTLTQKRMAYGQDKQESSGQEVNPSLPQNPQFPDQTTTTTFPIIVRATNGNPKIKTGNRWVKPKQSKRIKLSTVVEPEDMEGFFSKYAEICKAGMGALKKRDRSKRKKKEKKKKGDAKG